MARALVSPIQRTTTFSCWYSRLIIFILLIQSVKHAYVAALSADETPPSSEEIPDYGDPPRESAEFVLQEGEAELRFKANVPLCQGWTCADRCAINRTKPEIQTGALRCACDNDCVIFGDCCYDFAEICLGMNTSQAELFTIQHETLMLDGSYFVERLTEKRVLIPFLDCESVLDSSVNALREISMISRCPVNWSDNATRALCEKEGLYHDSILHYIPITDSMYPLWTFKNYHCAKCHQIPQSRQLSWEVKIVCSEQEDADMIMNKLTLEDALSAMERCSMSFTPPDVAARRLRVCQKTEKPSSDIYYCHTDSFSSVFNLSDKILFWKACDLYALPVTSDIGGHKNPHCSILCTPEKRNSICDIPHINQPVGNGPNFVILFNFNGLDSTLRREDKGKSTKLITGTCPFDHVYDVHRLTCVRLVCGKGRRAFRGECLAHNAHAPHSINEHISEPVAFSPNFQAKVMYLSTRSGSVVSCCDTYELHNKFFSGRMGLSRTRRVDCIELHDGVNSLADVNSTNPEVCSGAGFRKEIRVKRNNPIIPSLDSHSTPIRDVLTFYFQEDVGFASFLSAISYLETHSNDKIAILEAVFMNIPSSYIQTISSHVTCPHSSEIVQLQFQLNITIGQTYALVNGTNISLPLSRIPFNMHLKLDNDTLNTYNNAFACRPVSCPAVVYNQSEYVIKDGMLYLNGKSGAVYTRESFKIVNGSAHVCTNFAQNYTRFESIHLSNSTYPADVFFNDKQITMTIVCSSITLCCLFVTFLTYCLFRDLRNVPGLCVMSLTLALFLAHLFFVTTVYRVDNHGLCVAMAIIMHYLWLCVFAWTSAIAFDISRTFGASLIKRRSTVDVRHRFLWYSLICWLCPALIVIASIVVEFANDDDNLEIGYGAPSACWINNGTASLIVFALPVALSLMFNIGAVVVTAIGLHRSLRASSKIRMTASKSNRRREPIIIISLSAVFGLMWIFGYIAALASVDALWYVFILFAGLHGVFLFLCYVCKMRILKLYKQLFMQKMGSTVSKSLATSSTGSGNTTGSRKQESLNN